jgi:hypothetical protein
MLIFGRIGRFQRNDVALKEYGCYSTIKNKSLFVI